MEERIYKVSKIEGEYAILIDEKSGDDLFIALALLPDGTDLGSRLLWKDFEYTIIEK
ncbi:MAG: hypothetical protein J6R82_02050 [Clostridia bacterium]|nr:hypothetical protein [Clostridia bacterium]